MWRNWYRVWFAFRRYRDRSPAPPFFFVFFPLIWLPHSSLHTLIPTSVKIQYSNNQFWHLSFVIVTISIFFIRIFIIVSRLFCFLMHNMFCHMNCQLGKWYLLFNVWPNHCRGFWLLLQLIKSNEERKWIPISTWIFSFPYPSGEVFKYWRTRESDESFGKFNKKRTLCKNSRSTINCFTPL